MINRSRFAEDDEQAALFSWASVKANSGYMTRLLFAIPNGGKRNPREAVRMKLAGVKSGVPDMFLPVARNGLHGLWIELKRPIVKGEAKPVVSAEQKYWIEQLREQGYRAEVCYGWIEAKTLIEEYLK